MLRSGNFFLIFGLSVDALLRLSVFIGVNSYLDDSDAARVIPLPATDIEAFLSGNGLSGLIGLGLKASYLAILITVLMFYNKFWLLLLFINAALLPFLCIRGLGLFRKLPFIS